MHTLNRFHFIILSMICAMLACQTSAAGVPSQTAATQDLNMMIANTANAAMTLTALVSTPTLPESLTPSQTPTVTLTLTDTPSPTSIFSATPETPLISVSVSTNCRSGPGKVYDYRSALIVGEVVEIFARESTGNYWYIRNPEAETEEYCWVWGKYATIAGDTSALPEFTPPPTPTATLTPAVTNTGTATATKKASDGSFVVSYNNLDVCGVNWWLDLKVRNNGAIPFQSFKVNMKDMATNTTVERSTDVFADQAGCAPLTTKDVLDPGDILIFSGPDFSYDPTGHLIRISLTLCSNNGQKGTCAKQNFDVQL